MSRMIAISRAVASISGLLSMTLVGMLAMGCGTEESSRELAVVVPSSGPGAVYGEAVANGARLAVEELQAQYADGLYPYDLSLEILDSEGDPERAAELLRAAYDDGAVAAIGGVTDAEAVAMAPVADEQRRVLVSPSSSTPELSGASRHVFRVSPSGATEGAKMGSFATHELGLDRVSVVSTKAGPDSGALEAFRTEVERNRGEVVADVSLDADAEGKELESAAEEAVEKDPQAIYIVGAAEPVARFVAALGARGYRGAVMTTASFAVGDVLEQADGVLLSRPMFDPRGDDPAAQAFAESYEERFGALPRIHAAYAWDAVKVVAEALAEDGGRPAELWAALRGIQDFKGLTGFIQFDESGDVASFPRIYVVRDGELVEYGELGESERRRIARQVARLGANPAPLG